MSEGSGGVGESSAAGGTRPAGAPRPGETPRAQRGTIFLEEAEVLANERLPGGQRLLRLHAPRLAARAEPGSFAHIRCDRLLAMRRPMSVMRVDPRAGWAEFLYQEVGLGTALLGDQNPGARLSVLGPIGRGFALDPGRPRPLLIGGGVGIPPIVFLAERIHRDRLARGRAEDPTAATTPLVVMGSEVPFPFTSRPSQILVPGVPEGVIACAPLLEDWGMASRLASLQGYPGCFEGYATDLARAWLRAQPPAARATVAVYACGPMPMLAAAARLADDHGLPIQVCVEEYMACGVGGCAGCTLLVRDAGGPAMRRVCVDGPVFDGREVVWQ